MATAPVAAKKKTILKSYIDAPPKKGYTRYVASTADRTFYVTPPVVAQQVVEGNKLLTTTHAQAFVIKFKEHVFDADPVQTKAIEAAIAQPRGTPGKIEVGVDFMPAKLLGQLLEDDENEILDCDKMSYGGREKAINFIQVMANNSLMAGKFKGVKSIDEFKLKFTNEWQRRLALWGYTRAGELVTNDAKLAEVAKEFGVSLEVARGILSRGMSATAAAMAG